MSTIEERNGLEACDAVDQTAELVGGIAHTLKTLWQRAVEWVKVQSVRGYRWVATNGAPVVKTIREKAEVAVQYGIGLLNWVVEKAFRVSLRVVGVAGALTGRFVAYGAVVAAYATLQAVGVYISARAEVRKTIAAERAKWQEQEPAALAAAA
jgi:hypothetical protein